MNSKINSLDIEKMLFWDIECVRDQDELEIGSEAYKLFRQKFRNKDTDEFLPDEELKDLYKRKGALSFAHSKIVCITAASVRDGVIYVRTFSGEQRKIIEDFSKTLHQNIIPCGWNIIGFDFPLLRQKAFQEGVRNYAPDKFNDAGKKPWAMSEVKFDINMVDLMDLYKGSYFYSQPLAEACYMAGIPSPKGGGIDGSQVSEFYYAGKLKEIIEYCERDVVSCVHLFQHMQGKPISEEIVVVSDQETLIEEPKVFEAILGRKAVVPKEAEYFIEKAKSLDEDSRLKLIELIKGALGKADKDLDFDETELFMKIKKGK